MSKYVIGLDFGTDSVRAVLVNALDGTVFSTSVHWYQRWADGKFCNPIVNQYRQHPDDHLEGIEASITAVLEDTSIDASSVKAICIDTTGSSPIALNKHGIPLCYSSDHLDNPNAMVVLWKDHTAIKEAAEINQLARSWGGEDFTKFEGGIYSSEWFWAKILHVIREDTAIRNHAFTWMEHCDLMTYILVGSPSLSSFKRSRCAAGHKAMWHESWSGLPDDQFLERLDPDLSRLKSNMYVETFTSDEVAGTLCAEWSKKLGLSTDVIVTVGTFDAHAGAVGAEISEHTLVRVMGTSTCDIMVTGYDSIGEALIPGICGQVDGSVIPGMIGLEAGQSAFGDVLAWFKDVLCWPIDELFASHDKLDPDDIDQAKDELLQRLMQQAQKLGTNESSPIALDWINGRRTPDADQTLKAAIINLSLSTSAPAILRALVEAICFGSRKIVERFESEGIRIDSIVGIGGVAKKSEFVMQTLADVLNKPIKISNSSQAPALGAAMYAATAAGIYSNLQAAIEAMGSGFERTYQPNAENVHAYNMMYSRYESLGKFVEQK